MHANNIEQLAVRQHARLQKVSAESLITNGHAMQVPIQLLSAATMLSFASWAEQRLNAADVVSITALFGLLVLLAATQVAHLG